MAKSWPGRIYIGRDAEGKQDFYWVGRFATRKERDEAVALARVQKPWQTPTDHRNRPMNCERWATRMLDRMHSGELRSRGGRRYKRSTIDTARTQLKPFIAQFGERDPNTITRVEAEDWAATTYSGAIAIVIQLFNQLDRAEVVDRNRFEGLSKRPEGRRNQPPPTEEEMVLLLGACSALGDYAPVMRALVTFAAYTLLRPSELIDLVWENIVDNRVHVMTRYYRGESDLPKPNRTKVIALVPPARDALDELLSVPGYEGAGYVFRNKTGDRLTAPTLSGYWAQVRARSGLDFDLYHATKHYGVWFLKVRMDLADSLIAAQAGWSEKSVTKMVETYGHATDDRRLVELDAAFENDPRVLDDDSAAAGEQRP